MIVFDNSFFLKLSYPVCNSVCFEGMPLGNPSAALDLEKTVKRTMDLVRFKTARSTGRSFVQEINKCMAYVKDCLDTRLCLKEYNFGGNGEYPVMIAANNECTSPDVLLVGHIDVVDGDESQFEPYIKDDKIFGRVLRI